MFVILVSIGTQLVTQGWQLDPIRSRLQGHNEGSDSSPSTSYRLSNSRVTLKVDVISSPVVPTPVPIRPSRTRIFMFVTYVVELSVTVAESPYGLCPPGTPWSQWLCQKNKRMKSWYKSGRRHGTARVLHVQLYSCTVGQSGRTMVRLRCTNVIRWQDWAYRRIREGRRIRSWIREGRRIRSL